MIEITVKTELFAKGNMYVNPGHCTKLNKGYVIIALYCPDVFFKPLHHCMIITKFALNLKNDKEEYTFNPYGSGYIVSQPC